MDGLGDYSKFFLLLGLIENKEILRSNRLSAKALSMGLDCIEKETNIKFGSSTNKTWQIWTYK